MADDLSQAPFGGDKGDGTGTEVQTGLESKGERDY